MSGIRKSARVEHVTAKCGHTVYAHIPPGNLGPVGRRNIANAQANVCGACREAVPAPQPVMEISLKPTAEAYARMLLQVHENGDAAARNWARLEIERIFRVAATDGARLDCEIEGGTLENIPAPK